jgi:tetratricopeptide (TPR) repeat protein
LQGNSQLALQRVEQQLGKATNQAPLYQLLGQLSIGAKDHTKAIGYLEKAVELNPNLLSAYSLIGNVYATQKKFDAAIEQYQKVSKGNPKAPQPLMMIAILYELKEEPSKANEYYQKALDVNKNFAPAANNLAWNYAKHGGNLDVALSLAQRAWAVDANDPSYADTLGWIYYKKGMYGAALGLLKESNEKLKGQNPTVLYHLSLALIKTGDKKSAIEAVKKALALTAQFPERAEAKKLLASLEGNKMAAASSLPGE